MSSNEWKRKRIQELYNQISKVKKLTRAIKYLSKENEVKIKGFILDSEEGDFLIVKPDTILKENCKFIDESIKQIQTYNHQLEYKD
jgi:hypothetical protein